MEKRGFMAFPLFKKIIDESKGSVHTVNLHHRGEPLMHDELPKMIRYCRDNHIASQIHTNATLLTKKKATEIINAGLSVISFSVDGYDKKSYESIRIGACYEETIENIRRFLMIRKQIKKSAPYTIVEVIDFFQDEASKKKIIKKFETIKPDKLIIKKAHNWGGGYWPAPGVKTSLPNADARFSCTFPWYALTIFWDGTVVICPQDFFGQSKVGDLKKDTLKDIWNSQIQVNYRNKIKKMKYNEITSCRACDRPRRSHFFGIPISHLGVFLKENL